MKIKFMHYDQIPSPPETSSGANSLVRLMDGLAYRYQWATEGLTENEINFKPCESSMNMMELLKHLHGMADFVYKSFSEVDRGWLATPETFEDLRLETLDLYKQTSDVLADMTDEELSTKKAAGSRYDLPYWNLINGPMADALTHVGQITSWRRIAGNPIPPHNPFTGANPKS